MPHGLTFNETTVRTQASPESGDVVVLLAKVGVGVADGTVLEATDAALTTHANTDFAKTVARIQGMARPKIVGVLYSSSTAPTVADISAAMQRVKSQLGYRPTLIAATSAMGVYAQTTQGTAMMNGFIAAATNARCHFISAYNGQAFADEEAIDDYNTWLALHDDERHYAVAGMARVSNESAAIDAIGWVLGRIALSRKERGYGHSPSNQDLTGNGIVGPFADIDHDPENANSLAEIFNRTSETLNSSTKPPSAVILKKGSRVFLWGNDSTSTVWDKPTRIFSVRRAADRIRDIVYEVVQWYIDQNISGDFFQAVSDEGNRRLREEITAGQIASAEIVPSPTLNTPSNISAKKCFFDLVVRYYAPAESITVTHEIGITDNAGILSIQGI